MEQHIQKVNLMDIGLMRWIYDVTVTGKIRTAICGHSNRQESIANSMKVVLLCYNVLMNTLARQDIVHPNLWCKER